MKTFDKLLIAGEQSAGHLPVNAPGVGVGGVYLGSPVPGSYPQPLVVLDPFKSLARVSKIAIDLAQGKSPVAALKRSNGGGALQLQLSPIGQRLMMAIDEVAFATQMPENFRFEPDAQAVIDAVRLHWIGRGTSIWLGTAALCSVENPVAMGQVLNAIATLVRDELAIPAAIKQRLMHELKGTSRMRDIREALMPAISNAEGQVHVLQADLSVLPAVFGQEIDENVEAQRLKSLGQSLIKHVRVHFGPAVIAFILDHARLLGGHSLHMAVFFAGPGLNELESIRQELSGLWARCTAGRGVMSHTSVPDSPFHFRGLPPEEGALLSPRQNLARVAAFIAYREYFLREDTFGSMSDRLSVDLITKAKAKIKKPISQIVAETMDSSA